MRKVFLDDLPHNKSGNRILWVNSIGYIIKFIYENIDGYIKIIDYDKKSGKLKIIYNNSIFRIGFRNFTKCQLGKILEKYTSDFKIEIGTRLQDEKRDITIVNRKIIERERIDKRGKKNILKEKWYQYKCNICGFDCDKHYRNQESKKELWVVESSVLKGGCSCCSGHVVVEKINSIVKTDKWMIPFFQGGYDEAKLYTKTSNQKINLICPDCLTIKKIKIPINKIYYLHGISCNCSDSVPYGEKFIFSLLKQLGIDFEIQLTKTTFEWCDKYKYDFYFKLNNEQYICEINGIQHYEKAFDSCGGQTVEEVQNNDKLKRKLALNNEIKEENYIVIDCRYSKLEWIKDHIQESNLANIFELSKIDWLRIEEYACSNLVKVACEHKRNNLDLTTVDIGKIMGYSHNTVRKWLKQGKILNYCNYDANDEKEKIINQNIIKMKLQKLKPTICINNAYLSKSVLDMSTNSQRIFGVILSLSGISRVCRGERIHYKGYKFKYIEDLTPEEYIKYDIKNKLIELHNRELVQAI